MKWFLFFQSGFPFFLTEQTVNRIRCLPTLHKVHTVHTVKSAVSLKWQVGFENDMKITPIFTITFSSKMLIKQCFTSLEHTFLVDALNSPKLIYTANMYITIEL